MNRGQCWWANERGRWSQLRGRQTPWSGAGSCPCVSSLVFRLLMRATLQSTAHTVPCSRHTHLITTEKCKAFLSIYLYFLKQISKERRILHWKYKLPLHSFWRINIERQETAHPLLNWLNKMVTHEHWKMYENLYGDRILSHFFLCSILVTQS